MSIGKNIAKHRKSAGLTQEELGVKLGVTNQAVSKWESEVSMPDIMLLPKIASALNISLEDIYGIEKEPENISVSPDIFPSFCHDKLIELFYHNTKMKYTYKGSSDKNEPKAQIKELMKGFRAGCISNTKGAVIATEDFAFIDCGYKSENLVRMSEAAEYVLMYLSNRDVRKVLSFQYTYALNNSKKHNPEFTLEDIMNATGLTQGEAKNALICLEEININAVYTDDKNKMKKYVFLYSNAVYAFTIFKLAELLSEECPAWAVIRDTSIINDCAF